MQLNVEKISINKNHPLAEEMAELLESQMYTIHFLNLHLYFPEKGMPCN